MTFHIKSINDNKSNIETTLFEKDENNRRINVYHFNDVLFSIENTNYPKVIFKSSTGIYDPIEEKIMSLTNAKVSDIKINFNQHLLIEKTPVFYFIYNTDNYYHFLYDSLPYLISFFELKKKIPRLKLLMNSTNSGKFYQFVTEFLNSFKINNDDILIVDSNTLYCKVYVSNSYTHGIDSNLPPRKEIYDLYDHLKNSVLKEEVTSKFPKKIYVSRRTWLHNDFSNIGTNYTLRRKLENENEVAELLKNKGYEEVFTEKLNTIDKISMFAGATDVVGCIGGGISNCLFSNKSCNLIALISPTFLDVNKRFTYSFSNVNTTYFTDSYHVDQGIFKRYMRIQSGKIIGEIEEVHDDEISVYYTNKDVAGWNSELTYERCRLKKINCKLLDEGLNSPWMLNLEKLSKIIT